MTKLINAIYYEDYIFEIDTRWDYFEEQTIRLFLKTFNNLEETKNKIPIKNKSLLINKIKKYFTLIGRMAVLNIEDLEEVLEEQGLLNKIEEKK